MRFAIVGCGTIAQIMHLPYLIELPDVSVRALVDPDERRRDALAERYNVPHSHPDVERLLAEVGDELDAVVVATPAHTHADVVVRTLAADIDTLVEKPIAVTPEDADRMVEAEANSEATAMVAYMKRYDPAYERALTELDALDGIDLVTAYDVDPDHSRIVHEVYDLIDADLADSFVEESAAKRRTQIERAIGSDDETLVSAYDFQLDHVCHDVNALRGLLGQVVEIRDVDIFADGRYMTASLEYEGGTRCVLESGDADRKWFEQYIRVDAPDGMLRLDFANPFIKNTPTELRVKRGVEELEETIETPSYEESFKRELEYFIRCIKGDAEVRTTFTEARQDVELIANVFRSYQNASTIKRSD